MGYVDEAGRIISYSQVDHLYEGKLKRTPMSEDAACSGRTTGTKSSVSHTVLPSSPPPYPKRLVKTALHQAVLDGRLHQVRLLVSKHGVGVNCKDIFGRTPLMLTAMVDEDSGARMARILISSGADIGIRDNMGRTAISQACLHGRERIVDEILRKDILNISDPDNDGNTPLHHAASSGNPNIVKTLGNLFVKFGLDIDLRNSLGYTPLLLACRNGHFASAFHLLSECEASPALRDTEVFLNAFEWTIKSSRHTPIPIRRLIAPPSAPSFSREHSMYPSIVTPVCKHARPTVTLPAGSRADNLELQREETFVDGQDARQMVLNFIHHAEENSWTAKHQKKPKQPHPPTAKLLALSRRRTKSALPPDMTTIFKMYSDQYTPDWRREKTMLVMSSRRKDPKPFHSSMKCPSIHVN